MYHLQLLRHLPVQVRMLLLYIDNLKFFCLFQEARVGVILLLLFVSIIVFIAM